MSYTIITHQHKPDTKHKILITISPDYSETEIRTLIKEGFSRDVSRRLQSSSPWSRHSDVMQGSHCLSGERWTDTGHPRTVQCYKADKRLARTRRWAEWDGLYSGHDGELLAWAELLKYETNQKWPHDWGDGLVSIWSCSYMRTG